MQHELCIPTLKVDQLGIVSVSVACHLRGARRPRRKEREQLFDADARVEQRDHLLRGHTNPLPVPHKLLCDLFQWDRALFMENFGLAAVSDGLRALRRCHRKSQSRLRRKFRSNYGWTKRNIPLISAACNGRPARQSEYIGNSNKGFMRVLVVGAGMRKLRLVQGILYREIADLVMETTPKVM